jgi:hypothetical protein
LGIGNFNGIVMSARLLDLDNVLMIEFYCISTRARWFDVQAAGVSQCPQVMHEALTAMATSTLRYF